MRVLARSNRPLVATALLLSACSLLEDDGGGGGFGFRLAVLRNEGLVVSFDDGAQERRVTEAGTSQDPATNRAGTAIALLHSPDGTGSRALYRTSFAAGDSVDLVAAPSPGESFESPAWSPDGESLVVVETQSASSRLVRVPLEGGAPEPIAGAARGKRFPRFLGDDDDLLVVVDDVTREIELLTISSGSVSPLGSASPLRTDTRPAVSSDGSLVVFVDRDNDHALTLYEVATDTRTVLTLDVSQRPARPAFSPDDRYVAFVLGSQIYALAVDDSSESPILLQSGSDFAWGR